MAFGATNQMNIKRLIDGEYQKLRSKENDRFQLYANLIEIKKHYDLTDYTKSLYQDVKCWISYTYEDSDLLDFGYDLPDVSVFSSVIEEFDSLRKIRLYCYLRKKTSDVGYEYPELQGLIESAKIENLCQGKRWWSCFLHKIGCDWRYYFSVVLALLFLPTFAFLNAPCDWMCFFSCAPAELSNTSWINIISNVLSVSFGIGYEHVLIEPINLGGVIVMSLWKGMFLIFIANIFLQKILNNIDNALNG